MSRRHTHNLCHTSELILSKSFRLLAAPLLTLLTALPAAADMTRCLDLADDDARLACYDEEAGYAPAAGTPSDTDQADAGTDTGDWTIDVEKSVMDDSTNVFLFLDADQQTNCPYKDAPHTIAIACRENETNLWFRFGGCFMSDIQGKGRVTYRLDSDQARTKSFRESNNNMALGLWSGGQAIAFIKEMFGHERMIVRAQPFSESQVTGHYDIAGIETAIKPLREACNW